MMIVFNDLVRLAAAQHINQVVRDALARISLADLAMPVPGSIVPLASLGVDASNTSEQ